MGRMKDALLFFAVWAMAMPSIGVAALVTAAASEPPAQQAASQAAVEKQEIGRAHV